MPKDSERPASDELKVSTDLAGALRDKAKILLSRDLGFGRLDIEVVQCGLQEPEDAPLHARHRRQRQGDALVRRAGHRVAARQPRPGHLHRPARCQPVGSD